MKNPELFVSSAEGFFRTEITLRDLFAAAALSGMGEVVWSRDSVLRQRELAALCYSQADAMLCEREV